MRIRKVFLSLILFGMIFAPTKPVANAYAEDAYAAAKSADNWLFARTDFDVTDDGLKFTQTEMGTPDSHAISILEVPFTDTDSFEITFRMKMDEYVASGRGQNDVWAGIGIMGKPVFINWRNNEEAEPSPLTGHGRAKDSPGLFTRFFNYSGDLRYEGSVYHEDYHTLGEESGEADIVDTWRLYEGNAGASINSDVTLKLSFDDEDFYNVYLNGENITSIGEAAFIERDVIFPDGKIYLLLVMNTQDDPFNEFSTMHVKEINGNSFVDTGEDPGPDPGDDTSSEGPTASEPPTSETPTSGEEPPAPRSGCFAETIAGTATVAVVLVIAIVVLVYRRSKVV